jgi:hypothetical protein
MAFIFAINKRKYNFFFSSWRGQHYAAASLLWVFGILYLIARSFKHPVLEISLILLAYCYIFYRSLGRLLIRESNIVSNIIVRLEFHEGMVTFETNGFTLYGGLLNRHEKRIEVPLDKMILELSENNKIVRNKYMGYAFVAELDGVKYYLIGDFFDDFDEILKMFKG